MRSILLLIISGLLLSGCAFFNSSKAKKNTYAAITGDGLNPETPSHEIKEALTKRESMAGGDYHLEIYPITRPLVESLISELVKERGLGAKETKALRQKQYKRLLNDKSCVHFQYSVLRYSQVSELRSWKIGLIDKNKQLHPLSWNDDDLKKSPIITKQIRAQDNLPKWINTALACTYEKTDLSNGFSVQVEAAYAPFPFDTVTKYHWDFKHYKIEEGKKVLVDESKKSQQKYRGW